MTNYDDIEDEYILKRLEKRKTDEYISFSELIESLSDEKKALVYEALDEIAEERRGKLEKIATERKIVLDMLAIKKLMKDKKPIIVKDGIVQRDEDNPDYWFLLEDD